MVAVLHELESGSVAVWGVVISVIGTALLGMFGWSARQAVRWGRDLDRRLEEVHAIVDGWQVVVKQLTWDIAASCNRLESLERDRERFHPRS